MQATQLAADGEVLGVTGAPKVLMGLLINDIAGANTVIAVYNGIDPGGVQFLVASILANDSNYLNFGPDGILCSDGIYVNVGTGTCTVVWR